MRTETTQETGVLSRALIKTAHDVLSRQLIGCEQDWLDRLVHAALVRHDRLATIERRVIYRTADMPKDAIAWCKNQGGEFCHWLHKGPLRWEIAQPGETQETPKPILDATDAPDLRPDEPGPLWMPIIDPPEDNP